MKVKHIGIYLPVANDDDHGHCTCDAMYTSDLSERMCNTKHGTFGGMDRQLIHQMQLIHLELQLIMILLITIQLIYMLMFLEKQGVIVITLSNFMEHIQIRVLHVPIDGGSVTNKMKSGDEDIDTMHR